MSNVEGERLLEEMEKAMAGEEPNGSPDQPPPQPSPQEWSRKTELYEPLIKPAQAQAPSSTPTKTTAVQGIARDITRLTWREAETMGRAIEEKVKGKGVPSSLTAAIQDWAWGWQTFKEEEQPK